MEQIINIKYQDFDMTIVGYYEEEERTVWYYPDGSGHPGSPSYFQAEKVLVGGGENVVDILPLLHCDDVEAIEEIVREEIER